jgi:hypothetical protein
VEWICLCLANSKRLLGRAASLSEDEQQRLPPGRTGRAFKTSPNHSIQLGPISRTRQKLLAAVAADQNTPAFARASALTELAPSLSPANGKLARDGLSDPNPMVRIGALDMLENARPIRFGRSFRRFSPILSGACGSSSLFGSRHMPTQRRSEATQKPYSKTLYQNLDLTYVVAYDRRSIRQPDFLPSGRGYDRALGSGSRNILIGLGLGLPVTGLTSLIPMPARLFATPGSLGATNGLMHRSRPLLVAWQLLLPRPQRQLVPRLAPIL